MTYPSISDAITQAWNARSAFHSNPETNAYRIFHGYTEGCAGLSIDRYGSAAIINKKKDLPLRDEEIGQILETLFPFERIVIKSHQNIDAKKGGRVTYLKGAPASEALAVREHGDHFFCDLDSLHSNGLFLDARPARQWLKQNGKDARIYNMFAHTGSLGVAALLGGAKEVVHIDKSREALDKIQHNYRFNKLTPDPRAIVTGDIYFHLPRAIKWGQLFDGIILDPPPKVPPPPKAPKHRPEGQDFQTLLQLVMQLMKPGAWLLCIYHNFRKSHDDYDQEIIAAADHQLKAIWRGRADHDFIETDPDRWTRMSAFQKLDA
jgi:23S rRNA (cytosine1962-C5)-methyltransferase